MLKERFKKVLINLRFIGLFKKVLLSSSRITWAKRPNPQWFMRRSIVTSQSLYYFPGVKGQ